MEQLFDKRLDGFDNYVDEMLNIWNIPGAAVVVVKDGKIVYLKGHGYKNIKKREKVTPDTVFAIGSATKCFTALAAGILVDEGKLSWDTPVIKYMPWFKMYDSVATERLTVRDMLCHRSGLPRHEFMWYNSPINRRELVEKIRFLQPNKDFRSVWQYQNHMFAAAGQLIEEITGQKWEDFVQKRITTTLGMDDTNFSIDDIQKASDYALPYADNDGRLEEVPFRNVDAIGPAGAINSNIKDMVNWLNLQLNGGKVGENQIVSPATMGQIHTPQIPYRLVPWEFEEIKTNGYGLGWFIDIYRGRKMLHHGGSIDGFGSEVSFMPEENIGITVLTNLSGSMLGVALANEVYDRFLGLRSRNWGLELKTEVDKFRAMGKEAFKAMAVAPIEGTKPSHPIGDYVGEYENPGYGVLTIKKQDDGLLCIYNGIESILVHNNYDTFVYNYQNELDILASFGISKEGIINSVSLPLAMDPSVDDIVFCRREQA